ncbi:glycosyltransferase family 4 protein [soil metagenome]
MQVLTITTFFPNAAKPQRSVFVKNLVRAMQSRAEVRVISPVPYVPPFGLKPAWQAQRAIPAHAQVDGIDVDYPRFVVLPKLEWFSGFGYFLCILGVLRRHKREGRPFVVHVHCAYPDAVGVALAAVLLKIPYVVTAHGSDINVYAERPLLRFQIRWALRRALGIIAVSRALEAKISRLLGSAKPQIACIPCAAFDPSVFQPRRNQTAGTATGDMAPARFVVFVGLLVSIKGINFLIDAWAELQKRGKLGKADCLVILGDGPCRSSLEQQAKDRLVEGSVQFAGTVTQIEVARRIADAHLLCLPSLNEGTPNVVIEALACGVPVVASRVGGIPDLIRDGENGMLVEPSDYVALADALEQVLGREWDAGVVASSVSSMTWQTIAERNCDFLESLLPDFITA